MTVVHQHEHSSDIATVLAGDRLLPVVILPDAAAAEPLAAALTSGGLRSIEVTLRTPAAIDAIKRLAASSELLVGAGTVLTPDQAERAVEAGARYVVCPGFSAAVVRRCQELDVPVFPGVATPTEIQMALEAGLTAVKFFPAEQLGGAPMVKALSAPFPGMRFVPTGGVTTANLGAYLSVPAVLAVGGTWMVAADLLKAGDYAEITRRTAAAVAAARELTEGADDAR
ncbi:bifunctional 4-hydroxy-2-oxoglutarate aldolase/2-dehydro-3-deoxy-phosphogluconate aldolase [Catellatospora bangladeshensis]|uniref:bifunctional 4-hydroxy-2-oxoglutarate aldolase/2-dehydro-3-deoxy-phosphogluconate aldolase n=1 Tax=Catellatospora bangladeshensis TaxID=310355 RepID=UPI001945552D|nr:bifunctional 4-hydroxy-2-oxoglutarate aldolase/2-dehydro-3-deoxy-phosphogluconate aldolase [Catellatospora bangladeshensis]